MNVAAFEQMLRRIPGVEGARVAMDGASPSEVHILAIPGKTPKQLVRDVQSVAMAGFDFNLDRRVVSVVQIDSDDLGGGDRPVVEDVAEEIDGSKMNITVKLGWRDAQLVGNATGPAASTTRLKLVADATLAALEQALAETAAFAVTAVETPTIGSRQVAICLVVIVSGGTERTVVGSALLSTDPSKAVARAVLDALNRQVPSLKRGGL